MVLLTLGVCLRVKKVCLVWVGGSGVPILLGGGCFRV